MPYVFARRLGEDLKFFHENNMYGVFFDSMLSHWSTQGINYFVAAEIINRPDADVEDVLNEYYAAFGSASPAVRDYFEHWHEVTSHGPEILRERVPEARGWGTWRVAFVDLAPVLFDEEAFRRAEAHIVRAEQLSRGDRQIIRDRVAFLRLGLEHSRLTARAVESVGNAAKSPSPRSRRLALESQENLWRFRQQLYKEHPYAVNAPLLIEIERRRNFMWHASSLWYEPLD